MDSDNYDIVVIGGGLVGASLGVALQECGRSVLVVEPVVVNDSAQPSFDERTVALTYCARRIFTAMDIWDEISRRDAEPILEIHVSNRSHTGQTLLSHTHAETEALGYVVATRVLGRALWTRLGMPGNVATLCPATVESIQPSIERTELSVRHADSTHVITAGMVVLADGGRSPLLDQLDFEVERQPYEHSAILCFTQVDRPHHGRAFERFTAEGPLALLPFSDTILDGKTAHRYAVVWTTDDQDVARRMSLDDAAFIDELQTVFGDRAGSFLWVSPRKSYPLSRNRIADPVRDNIVVVGNAAHTVHPVAGQGFNLGLRDAAVLADLVHTSDPETGWAGVIDEYSRMRQGDTRFVNSFTHGLIQTFTRDAQPLPLLRNLGLHAIELLPPLKRRLLRRTMGIAGTASPMLCGITPGRHRPDPGNEHG